MEYDSFVGFLTVHNGQKTLIILFYPNFQIQIRYILCVEFFHQEKSWQLCIRR